MKKNKKNDMVCETSSIRFGKLDIVLQSFNSVPDIASFYNTTSAGVTNTTTLLVHGNNTHNNTTLCDIVPCSINRRFTPITSENIGGDVMCWWCHVNVISVSNSCFLPSNYDEKKNVTVNTDIFVVGNARNLLILKHVMLRADIDRI